MSPVLYTIQYSALNRTKQSQSESTSNLGRGRHAITSADGIVNEVSIGIWCVSKGKKAQQRGNKGWSRREIKKETWKRGRREGEAIKARGRKEVVFLYSSSFGFVDTVDVKVAALFASGEAGVPTVSLRDEKSWNLNFHWLQPPSPPSPFPQCPLRREERLRNKLGTTFFLSARCESIKGANTVQERNGCRCGMMINWRRSKSNKIGRSICFISFPLYISY